MSKTSCLRCGGLHPLGTEACPESELVGRTLANGFRVVERLGETSHGSLYRAEVAESGVEVDLITLSRDSFGTQAPGETPKLGPLWDQLSRARGINHPNIAGVKEMGRTPEGVCYVALEVFRGELLSEILNSRRVLPLKEAVDLILQAASGLQAAHEVGLLHGSLSPDNILVTRTVDNRPLVKLIRFELAQHGTAPPAGGKWSISYASPERLGGHAGDERSDIFSLGAVLHHVLTGEPPSADSGEPELIPEAARAVVSRALEPLPGHRFGTVAAFARALAAVRDESAEQGKRAEGGRRGAVAIGAGLVIVAVAGLWLLRSSERPRPEPVSGRRVTVSGAAPAGQVGDSVSSLPAPRDTASARSPKSGTATLPFPDLSRRKRSIPNAPASVREEPSTTPESAPAEVRESKVVAPERAEAGVSIPEAAAPPRPEVSPKAEVRSLAAAKPAGVPPAPQEQPGSAAITPENFDAGDGATGSGDGARVPAPVASGPADSAVGYAPSIAAEAPGPAESLTRTAAMRLALSDAVRLQIAASYEEVRPGLLVLVLGSGFRTSTSLDYNFRKLYAAYTELLNYPDNDPVMELWQNEDKIGEYTRDGLHVGPEYVTPR
jgi:serine/threonine-protein kinase